ncbi:acyl-CoA dehydrogenase family protein [Conexibacter sp. CPCC 206217]|uniref:acyl-CoA dehydrogenase family protein n=1 Tax=Conexibacter sp. CPCC 206217 TaxID=3064574 RepID=UPI002717C0B8|nr:acyl-CoA dehydrogenase family protein [Conexibacter sp. CPCC 206217]MDO8212360.1 acyl-CoA dehydrogenase family protein [Conexibacter sp. CPCC 206217]
MPAEAGALSAAAAVREPAAVPAGDAPQHEPLAPARPVAALPAELAQLVAGRAADVDAGLREPRAALERLARVGLLTLGLEGAAAGTLADQFAVISALGERCMATAFSAWGHRIALEYLAGRPELAQLAPLARIGSSAMASGFKAAVGLGPAPVRLRDGRAGRFVLDGRIPWASNLHPDALVVLAAEREDGALTAVAVDVAAAGVTVRPARGLLALDATASGQLELDGVSVSPETLLDEPFPAFAARVRPAFLLLQSAFCSGLARASLAAGEPALQGLGAEFASDHADASERLAAIEERATALAGEEGPLRAFVRLRLDVALLARDAVRIESAVAGGRGYVASSPTARRLREAAFLPVQSPTEGQLRWELRRGA